MKVTERLAILEVGKIINRKDRESIISWLIQNKVKIYRDKQPFVYKIDVEMENLRPLVIDCKENYPELWKEKLKILCDGNIKLYDLFILEMDNSISITAPLTRVKPMNKQQEELLKRIYR